MSLSPAERAVWDDYVRFGRLLDDALTRKRLSDVREFFRDNPKHKPGGAIPPNRRKRDYV